MHKMDVGAITTIISNIGFPIACVVVLFITQEKDRERQALENEKTREMLSKMSEAINSLTAVNQRLLDKMER